MKASQKTPVASAVISGPEASIQRIELVAGDVGAAGRIRSVVFRTGGDEVEVSEVEFAVDESEQGQHA